MDRIDTARDQPLRNARDSPVFVDSPIVAAEPRQPPMPSADTLPSSSSAYAGALSYLIFSGGTGANSIANAFGPSPAFVLPVSDDGGSSSEILRCFGGPSIGDISQLAESLRVSLADKQGLV